MGRTSLSSAQYVITNPLRVLREENSSFLGKNSSASEYGQDDITVRRTEVEAFFTKSVDAIIEVFNERFSDFLDGETVLYAPAACSLQH